MISALFCLFTLGLKHAVSPVQINPSALLAKACGNEGNICITPVKSKSIKIKLKSNSVICKAKQFEFCFLKIFKNGKQSTPSSDRMNNNVEFLKKLKNHKIKNVQNSAPSNGMFFHPSTMDGRRECGLCVSETWDSVWRSTIFIIDVLSSRQLSNSCNSNFNF